MKEQDQMENEIPEEESPLLLGVYLLNICVFLIAIVGVGALAWILPKETESLLEKRELAEAPTFSISNYFSGEFAKQTDMFFADTFPGRDGMVSFASKMEEMRGIRPGDVRIYNAARPSTDIPKDDLSDDQTDPVDELGDNLKKETEPAPGNGLTPDDGAVRGEQLGPTFLYKNMAMAIFGGNSAVANRYAQAINKYQAELGDSVQIYNMVIPTSIAFYLPEKNKDISGDQKENIDMIYAALDPKVKRVDAYTSIDKVKEQYIYFRSDHHWTVRGAYAAYEAFCETAGLEPVPLSEMEHHQIDNFVGTLYNETQDSKLKETPDFVEYFVPPGDFTVNRYLRNKPKTPVESSLFASYATGGQNTYSVFLHGDYPLTHVVTGKNTGRKILMVKESFGNAFAPFLVSHFDEVFIVDQRYFQLGLVDFIKEKGVTDLLFANNIFAANTDVRVNEISRITNQRYAPYVPKPVPPPPPPEPEETLGESGSPLDKTDENAKDVESQENHELDEEVQEESEEDKPKKIIKKSNREQEEQEEQEPQPEEELVE